MVSPLETQKDNITAAIEEAGTLIAVLFMGLLHQGLDKETVGTALIIVLCGIVILTAIVEFVFLVSSIIRKSKV